MIQGNLSAYSAQHYRTVFLSDFHMGAKSFDAAALLDFLKSIECDYMYLAGDIIDGWKLNKRWHWTEDCNAIIDELIRKADNGTKIIYLPGNHDDEIRRILPFSRGRFAKKLGIKIKDKAIHTLADGRQFLVLHGDQFDRKILRGPLPKWSDRTYHFMAGLIEKIIPQTLPTIKVKGEKKPFSLAKALKNHGKLALYLLNNFENAAYKIVQEKEVDGLICGHTHIPTIKTLKDITYANAGSWVSAAHTALVEKPDGTLKLLDWPNSYNSQTHIQPSLKHPNIQYKIIAVSMQYRPTTEMITKRIQEIWAVKTKPPKHLAQFDLQNLQNTKKRFILTQLPFFKTSKG
ncbi:UDP-2,3-diacylglucosamine diphosphatase [Alphaproteobacteria bacterium]|nr:UDP-2,3-diacylglucosamine diphosphatase [Alphaproteobacteria bacterium]